MDPYMVSGTTNAADNGCRQRNPTAASVIGISVGARNAIHANAKPTFADVPAVDPPPDCCRIAVLPYCEVNCANASPVISQLATAQPTNDAKPGPLTSNSRRKARRSRGGPGARIS